MKVAYNACYGGFSLSPLAEAEYRKKKGISLTWYKRDRDLGKSVRIDDGDLCNYQKEHFGIDASTKDLGSEVVEIPVEHSFYESWYDSDNRSDPDLIAVIEELGDKASGSCASIAIAEIPDGSSFEIDEYDGNESVVPPRQSW